MSGSQNFSSPNFVIPYVMPSNIPLELVPLFKPLYLAFQNIIQTLIYFCGIAPRSQSALLTSRNDPTAFLANNMHRFYAQASESILQGAAVNLFASVGVLFVRNANATDGSKPCDGFCSQTGGIAAGSVGEVILGDGMISGSLSGLVPGSRYYLSTSAGQYTTVPPTSSGNLQQSLGIAIDATNFRFLLGQQVQH